FLYNVPATTENYTLSLHDALPICPYAKSKLRERLAKLTGTGATIQVAGATKRAQELLKEQVEAAVTSTRSAMEAGVVAGGGGALDRKSTRLNSSHSQISYAVFCLK